MNQQSKNDSKLVGDVGRLIFVIDERAPSNESDIHDYYRYYVAHQDDIEKIIKTSVNETFGHDYFVSGLSINRGSVEIVVFIAGVLLSGYVGISRYKNFIESVDLLRRQIRGKLAELPGIPPDAISASWEPLSKIVPEEKQALVILPANTLPRERVIGGFGP